MEDYRGLIYLLLGLLYAIYSGYEQSKKRKTKMPQKPVPAPVKSEKTRKPLQQVIELKPKAAKPAKEVHSFDHSIKTMSTTPKLGTKQEIDKETSFINPITKILQDPNEVRKAIIINEVLKRPQWA